jgi:hypothetical protein
MVNLNFSSLIDNRPVKKKFAEGYVSPYFSPDEVGLEAQDPGPSTSTSGSRVARGGSVAVAASPSKVKRQERLTSAANNNASDLELNLMPGPIRDEIPEEAARQMLSVRNRFLVAKVAKRVEHMQIKHPQLAKAVEEHYNNFYSRNTPPNPFLKKGEDSSPSNDTSVELFGRGKGKGQ